MTPQQLHAPTPKPATKPTPTDHEDLQLDLPDDLTSAEAKLVFLFVSVRGTTTVDELGNALGLPKLTLFTILQTLGKKDLVARDGDTVYTA